MELWIRSQNKTELMRVIDLDIFDNGEPISYFIESRGIILGEYKSKERALEVLDEIQEHLDYLYIDNLKNAVDEKGFRVSNIYQMPEK